MSITNANTSKLNIVLSLVVVCFYMAMNQANAELLTNIVVSVQKRDQHTSDVPASVSVYNESFLEERLIYDIEQLTEFSANFDGGTSQSFIDSLSIRGIFSNDYGIGGDPSVAIFSDGVWQGRAGGVQMALYDTKRVEVIRGPQGLLFGRNAIAGAISIINNQPVQFSENSVSLSLAQLNQVEATGTINVPLNTKWSSRSSVYLNYGDGYITNQFDGEKLGGYKTASMRTAVRYLDDDFDFSISATYEQSKDSPALFFQSRGNRASSNAERQSLNIDTPGKDENNIVSLTAKASYILNNDMTLSSVTGYKNYKLSYLEDGDNLPYYIKNNTQEHDVHFVSQELWLNSPENADNPWFVGLSAYKENAKAVSSALYDENALCNIIAIDDMSFFTQSVTQGCADINFLMPLGINPNVFDPSIIETNQVEAIANSNTSTGFAGFANIDWVFKKGLSLSLGARYSYDKKNMSVGIPKLSGFFNEYLGGSPYALYELSDTKSWSKFTPRIVLAYRYNSHINYYLNWSKGYKTGGYASYALDLDDAFIAGDGEIVMGGKPLSYDNESVTSVELGMKGQSFDNHLLFNANFFTYQYTNLQLRSSIAGVNTVSNVGQTIGRGAESELIALFNQQWDAQLSVSALKTNIRNDAELVKRGICLSCEGNRLPFAPQYSGLFVLNYHYPLGNAKIKITFETLFQGEMYSDINNLQQAKVHSWQKSNLRFNYKHNNGYSGSVWIRNLSNESYFERGFGNSFVGYNGQQVIDNAFHSGLSRPRTIGVSFMKRF